MTKITPSSSRIDSDVVQFIAIIVVIIIMVTVFVWSYSNEYGCSNCGKVAHPADAYCSRCGKQLRIK